MCRRPLTAFRILLQDIELELENGYARESIVESLVLMVWLGFIYLGMSGICILRGGILAASLVRGWTAAPGCMARMRRSRRDLNWNR